MLFPAIRASLRSGLRRRAAFFAAACLGLLFGSGRVVLAQITLTAEAKNGEKISDIYTLTIRASAGDGDDGIDKVEFRIDDTLRHTDESTPYTYAWDTIQDTEGEHKVAVTAFDSSGRTKSLQLNLVIDNQLGQGADALALKAQEALKAMDRETATRFSRRALKADPENSAANRVLASLYAAQQDWTRAIAALEKVKAPAGDTSDLATLAGYRMQRAARPENAANFVAEMEAINGLRRKIAEAQLQKAREAHPPSEDPKAKIAGHIAVGDALLRAGQLQEALREYGQCDQTEVGPPECITRLALALTLNNQLSDATRLIRALTRTNRDDAGSRAVLGLILLRSRQFAEALKTVQADADRQHPGALVVAAFANAALGKRREALAGAKAAVEAAPGAGEAQYALAIFSNDPLEADRALIRSLSLAPFHNGPYLHYALRTVMGRNAGREQAAQALDIANYVLKSDPEHVGANLLKAQLFLHTERVNEAEPLLDALLKQDNKSIDVLMAAVIYSRLKDRGDRVNAFLDAVRMQDAEHYNEMARLKTPMQTLSYFTYRLPYRMHAFLTPATLYPEKS